MDFRIKCYLLDDEIPSLKYLKLLCSQIENLEVVRAFDNPIKLLQALEKERVDLCILDIQMPHITGLELTQHLKGIPVIFITAYKEFAADAFDLHAIDYIRKPLTVQRLKEAISKAVIYNAAFPNTSVQFLTDQGHTIIPAAQICYIRNAQADRRDKILFLTSGAEIKLKNISFEEILERTASKGLIRISKSAVIAWRHIVHYTMGQVTMQFRNGQETILPLSPVYKEAFLEAMQKQ